MLLVHFKKLQLFKYWKGQHAVVVTPQLLEETRRLHIACKKSMTQRQVYSAALYWDSKSHRVPLESDQFETSIYDRK